MHNWGEGGGFLRSHDLFLSIELTSFHQSQLLTIRYGLEVSASLTIKVSEFTLPDIGNNITSKGRTVIPVLLYYSLWLSYICFRHIASLITKFRLSSKVHHVNMVVSTGTHSRAKSTKTLVNRSALLSVLLTSKMPTRFCRRRIKRIQLCHYFHNYIMNSLVA